MASPACFLPNPSLYCVSDRALVCHPARKEGSGSQREGAGETMPVCLPYLNGRFNTNSVFSDQEPSNPRANSGS